MAIYYNTLKDNMQYGVDPYCCISSSLIVISIKLLLKIVLAIMNSVTQTYFNYLISENWLLNMTGVFTTKQVNFNVAKK